jgi:hypothetical protein
LFHSPITSASATIEPPAIVTAVGCAAIQARNRLSVPGAEGAAIVGAAAMSVPLPGELEMTRVFLVVAGLLDPPGLACLTEGGLDVGLLDPQLLREVFAGEFGCAERLGGLDYLVCCDLS